MSQVELNGQSFTLDRFPVGVEEASLQAWDAADEYLLQQVNEVDGPVLIFNDSFGALACALASHRPVSVNDSYIAELATQHNLRINDLDETVVTLQDSLSPLPANPALVLIKVPKQLALLEQQLRALRNVVTPQTRIIAGAKARDVHNSTLALFEKILGPTTTTLAWKKARLINCTFSAPALEESSVLASWKLDGTNWTIHNHANVFSRSGLDIGARFFLQHLPENVEGEMVDLGCGNGVIGLKLLAQNPNSRVLFADESAMAVASARLNVEANLPQAVERSEYMINNSLSGVEPDRFDAIMCNPPFHQQSAITDHIAWQMFNDARYCLKYGGELRIVGNRHLDYFRKLKRVFGNCETLATNNKFVVLKAVKVRKKR
ncbi:23S rRNA (guanine(1835)-N(2))-methyltransferase [Kosakonia sacchari]|uniref:Ribosomal RNA large subunit methyltransferase G n=1 Tax=Kosakonia sacchari TaxID=1158459 RepID=A0A1G4XYA8_9ENTR|nr:23S rRNA (guanine(1835)-N(2))-methyltransferase RlmG [Kosakonia sacchari]AHJ76491.1 23S rRNA (guanine(1835)-N(2))-methyltransferase [Kosakonia sacchari SP1]ANR78908.1 23S rRNA (guanine(1835)-N(2))-methyltransferase [Kosakonia sacchari]SCX46215.1 23S rRNA (guanine1835-N2)-methyltransferase [Kosakonia sacchari]